VGASGRGCLRSIQLTLCGRPAGWLAAADQRASCHQPRVAHRRCRRRDRRAPRTSRAWAACCRRWVMRWSARTWLSPACWLFMSFPFLWLGLFVPATLVEDWSSLASSEWR
jgi:hypothetical protein